VRAATSGKERLKKRWYEAVGLETVIRPLGVSSFSDLKKCLEVVRSGRCLGITPDLMVSSSKGVPVRIFGRDVHVAPGAFTVAMLARVPVVTPLLRWRDDDHAEIIFTEPIAVESARQRGEFRSACRKRRRPGCGTSKRICRCTRKTGCSGWTSAGRGCCARNPLAARRG
jgi:hypothetical protein